MAPSVVDWARAVVPDTPISATATTAIAAMRNFVKHFIERTPQEGTTSIKGPARTGSHQLPARCLVRILDLRSATTVVETRLRAAANGGDCTTTRAAYTARHCGTVQWSNCVNGPAGSRVVAL